MTEQKATNVHWHEGEIQREHRHQLLGQQGATLWFTGLSGSGKSTVAVALEEELFKRGKLSYRLDGDNIRLGINKNLGFTAEDRTENIRRIGEVAKLFVDCGVIVLTSFISPYRADRDVVRALHAASGMLLFSGQGGIARQDSRVTERWCLCEIKAMPMGPPVWRLLPFELR